MMQTLSEFFQIAALVYGLLFCIVGLKAVIVNKGPGPIELLAMMWRGEIKSKM